MNEVFEALVQFLRAPSVLVRISPSEELEELREAAETAIKKYNDLQARYERLEYQYIDQCKITMSLADENRALKKKG